MALRLFPASDIVKQCILYSVAWLELEPLERGYKSNFGKKQSTTEHGKKNEIKHKNVCHLPTWSGVGAWRKTGKPKMAKIKSAKLLKYFYLWCCDQFLFYFYNHNHIEKLWTVDFCFYFLISRNSDTSRL